MNVKQEANITSIKNNKLRYLPNAKIHLINTKRFINYLVETQDFLCYDTETYKGRCKLIADSNERYIYNPTFSQCLDFLFLDFDKPYYRAFWNIDFDISAILKLWNNIPEIDKLIHGEIIFYNGFELYYIRNKMFRISKDNVKVYIVDLFNVFQTGLDKASKKYLKESKLDTIDANKLNTVLTYWVKNYKDIIKYCKKDAVLTAKLGNWLVNNAKEVNLPLPKFITSHASFSKQYFRSECYIPSIDKIPINILDIAFETYFGGRFELLKRGYFEKLYLYDINSAYPDVIRDLPSLKYGTWNKVNKPNKNECLGFYKVFLDIKESYISAFPILYKNGSVIYPNGVYSGWITWYELDLLSKWVVDFVYGYEFVPGEAEYFPFRKAIDYLYKVKTENKNKDNVLYWFYKKVLNALYGCFIERHRKVDGLIYSGVLFNSVYASIITAKTRWRLLKDVKKSNWKYLCGFHTDSLISTKKLNLICNDDIGNWGLVDVGEGVLINTGIYQLGKKITHRGFKTSDLNWFDKLFENYDKTEIPFSKRHMLRSAECLKRYHNIDKVNTFIEQNRNLNINSDKKRIWNRDFRDCRDLLTSNIDSKPLEFYHIANNGLK